jgi:hypothetical protein
MGINQEKSLTYWVLLGGCILTAALAVIGPFVSFSNSHTSGGSMTYGEDLHNFVSDIGLAIFWLLATPSLISISIVLGVIANRVGRGSTRERAPINLPTNRERPEFIKLGD